jgi:hypothetical protein
MNTTIHNNIVKESPKKGTSETKKIEAKKISNEASNNANETKTIFIYKDVNYII